MCALVSQQNLSPATQALCMENGEKYKCSISVMVLLSVPCVTFWVLLGCAILRRNLLFFRYFISEFHKGGLLVHFIMSFICKLRQGLLQCLRSTPSVLCRFSVSTDISMVSVIKKKKVMCSMLLLLLLYIVFNTIIKATTGHQTLQVIGKHMQMVFLIIRFLLLQYVMKCR